MLGRNAVQLHVLLGCSDADQSNADYVEQMGDALASARADWPAKLDTLALGLQIGATELPWNVGQKLADITQVTPVLRRDCAQQFKSAYTLRYLLSSFYSQQPTVLPHELGETTSCRA